MGKKKQQKEEKYKINSALESNLVSVMQLAMAIAKPPDFSILEFEKKAVDYEFCIKDFKANRWRLDEVVNSPTFPEKDLPEWFIQVCPKGRKDKDEKFGAFIMLKNAGNQKFIPAEYKINFLNDSRVPIKPGGGQMRFAVSMGFGYVISEDSTEPIPTADSGNLIINVQISLILTPTVTIHHDNKIEVKCSIEDLTKSQDTFVEKL